MTSEASTALIEIPEALIDQVIGQEKAVEIARLAAKQRRFLLLVGEPGTGKSLIGRAMAELLPKVPDFVVAALPNPENPASPLIVCEPAEAFARRQELLAKQQEIENGTWLFMIGFALLAGFFVCTWLSLRDRTLLYLPYFLLLGSFAWLARRFLKLKKDEPLAPKIIHRTQSQKVPFVDATGCNDGALFGDVRHDPYQSGGSETAPHFLVEAGAIHKAHGGVLYIDEIGQLSPRSQKILLSAIQDKKLPITGRQSGSSGRMVCTEPVPCDFVLVAAGNLHDLSKILPALRSRFAGFGYEILMKDEISDTEANQEALVRFLAQEVKKDGRIPHFASCAAAEILAEARRRARNVGHFTARLRDLGGLVRTAGDLAVRADQDRVSRPFVREALRYAVSIEEQQRREQNELSQMRP